MTGFAAVLACLWLIARRARRRGIPGSMLGVFDEMWHPAAIESRIEIHVQAERRAPIPNGDDE